MGHLLEVDALQLIYVILLGYLVYRFIFRFPFSRKPLRLHSAAVLVLGDVGRSPRMMYHAESLAEHGFEIYIIGNRGSKPVPSLLSIPHVHFLYLSTPSNSLARLPFVLSAPKKVIHQVFSILNALLFRVPQPPEFIIVQNPPSIPTLALVWLVSKIQGNKVIIDWHNLGYSILALKLGQNHIFVRVAKWIEAYFGRTAYAHLFVTNAMKNFLVKEWDLQGHKVVLHDRPPAHFHRASPSEMHELFLDIDSDFATPALQSFLPATNPPYSTPFTIVSSPSSSPDVAAIGKSDSDIPTGGHSPYYSSSSSSLPMPIQRHDRPALLVSSTSWTPDEDFGILLHALDLYEAKARQRHDEKLVGKGTLPKVMMIVTGKGPEKDKYMCQVEKMQKDWEWVRCVSMWLEPGNYPLLLGSADLGISLHSSSSSLDLPMKVVDMFGCGLPVCALDFSCLDELVKDGVNGLVFKDAEQLASHMESLLTTFPTSTYLTSLRTSLEQSEKSGEWVSWSENWNKVMRPVLFHDFHS